MSINTAMYNGLSGLNSFSTAISVVSDNISNANTTAYKSNSIRFGDMVNTFFALQTNSVQGEGAGSAVLGVATDFAQGTLLGTSAWSDVAISGEGFFSVLDPVANRTYYTRDGSFHLDGAGYLVNPAGYQVIGSGGAAIQIANPENYTSFRVETDGTIVAVDTATGLETTLGVIELSTFTNKNGLVRQGSNMYMTGPEVGQTYTKTTDPGLFGNIVDTTIEGSNVDLAKEMVDMIIYQASYNANSKSITTGSQMIDTAINMVR